MFILKTTNNHKWGRLRTHVLQNYGADSYFRVSNFFVQHGCTAEQFFFHFWLLRLMFRAVELYELPPVTNYNNLSYELEYGTS